MRIVTRSGITHVSNPGGSLQELLNGRSELRLSIQFLVRGGARNRRSTTQIGDERRSSCESVLLSGAHGAAAAHVIPLLPPLPSVAARAILRMRNPYQTGGGESRTVDAADSPQSTTGQTATHRGGWIDPRVVPNRVRGLKDANASIDHYTFVVRYRMRLDLNADRHFFWESTESLELDWLMHLQHRCPQQCFT